MGKGGHGILDAKGMGSAGTHRAAGKDGDHARESPGVGGGIEGRGHTGRREENKLTAEERHRYAEK